MEGRHRADTAADVEDHLADALAHRVLGSHGIGPEAVDRAVCERPRGSDPERHAGLILARHTDDAHGVALKVDAGVDQQLL